MILDDTTFNQITTILNLFIIPLLIWIWKTDRKTLILESEIKAIKENQLSTEHKIDVVLQKILEIKDEIHNGFVSQKSCDFRHKTL